MDYLFFVDRESHISTTWSELKELLAFRRRGSEATPEAFRVLGVCVGELPSSSVDVFGREEPAHPRSRVIEEVVCGSRWGTWFIAGSGARDDALTLLVANDGGARPGHLFLPVFPTATSEVEVEAEMLRLRSVRGSRIGRALYDRGATIGPERAK